MADDLGRDLPPLVQVAGCPEASRVNSFANVSMPRCRHRIRVRLPRPARMLTEILLLAERVDAAAKRHRREVVHVFPL